MRKLWSAVDTAVTAGAAQLKQSVLTPVVSSASAGRVADDEGSSAPRSNAPGPGAPEQKQYLRLPLESARKLRWYDKAELAAIVRTHVREKGELQDAVAALKKLLLRAGMSEKDIDAEVAALVGHADNIRESDEGVASVLLAALQSDMDDVKESSAKMEAELAAARARIQELEEAGFTLEDGSSSSRAAAGAGQQGGRPAAGLDPALVEQLARAMESFESAMGQAAVTARRIRTTESDLSASEAAAAVQMYAAQQRALAVAREAAVAREVQRQERREGWDGEDGEGEEEAQLPPSLNDHNPAMASLMAKLQRLEAERRLVADEVADLSSQLEMARGAVSKVSQLTDSLAASEEEASTLRAQLEAARAEVASLRERVRAAEDAAEKRGAEVRRLQASAAGAADLARMRDMCAEAEERAIIADRRLSVAEARVAKAEGAMREAQAAAKERLKEKAAVEADRDALKALLDEARAKRSSSENGNGAGGASGPEVTRLMEQLRKLEEDLKGAQRDAAASAAALHASEARAAASEAREARLMAEMREMEGVAAEREELGAQVAALRERLSDTRAERGQLEHYKQMAASLEASRGRIEEELVVTGQLVTSLEARLREALARVDAAETAAQMGEGRVRAAEAGVAREVELRMSAAASNRTLWPAPIREEFARLEARAESLTSSLAAAQSRLDAEGATVSALLTQKGELTGRVRDLEDRLAVLDSTAGERIRELEDSLEMARGEALSARAAAVEAEAAARKASAALAMRRTISHATDGPNSTGSGFGASGANTAAAPSAAAATAAAAHKWQVQNRVGGGSLYGVADEAQIAALVEALEEEAGEGHHDSAAHELTHSHAEHSSQRASGHQLLPPMPPPGLPSSSSSTAQPHTPHATPARIPSTGALSSRLSSGSLSAMAGPGGHSHGPSYSGTQQQGGSSKHPTLEGVDVVYLKNVVLKFMEAAMAGRGAERDALLPAVATLLQATPAEYKVLRKVCANTAPAHTQVLSAFGIRL